MIQRQTNGPDAPYERNGAELYRETRSGLARFKDFLKTGASGIVLGMTAVAVAVEPGTVSVLLPSWYSDADSDLFTGLGPLVAYTLLPGGSVVAEYASPDIGPGTGDATGTDDATAAGAAPTPTAVPPPGWQ